MRIANLTQYTDFITMASKTKQIEGEDMDGAHNIRDCVAGQLLEKNNEIENDPGLNRFANVYGYNNIEEFASDNGYSCLQDMATKNGCRDIYDFIQGTGYAARLEPLRKEST